MKKVVLSAVAAVSLVMGAEGADANPLKTHTELGYIKTNGNTDTQTFSFDAKITKSIQKHNFELLADAQYGKSDGVETQNKYKIVGNYYYQLWQTVALQYTAGYKDDKFSGFDYQFVTGPSLRWDAYASKKQTLVLSGGILYSQDKIANGDSTDYTSVAAALGYSFQVLENLKFTQDATYRTQIDEMTNYFATSKTAFTSKLSDMLSAGISYKVDYAHIPPAGKKSTDTTFTANLIIDY